jgi:hypothetical protein
MAFPLLAAILLTASPIASPAEAVLLYGEAVAHNRAADLARAFQPSAIMYCTDGRDVHATYQAQWKARMEGAAPPAQPVSTKVEWLDVGATSALARAQAVRGGKTFTDYLLLANLGGDWRIVGKLCEEEGSPSPASTAAVNAVIDAKLASDRSWNAALLAQSIDPRALVMTVEQGELVAATLAEWQARYVERRAASPGNPAVEAGRVVDARGNIGVGRWSFRGTDGSLWTDRALLIRTAAGWKMMALLYAKEPPAPAP